MILLKDLFSMLATGEFSNMSLTRSDSGQLHEKEYAKVIGHINLGLTEIYKRFRFLEGELRLHALPQIGTYYLREDRMVPVNRLSNTNYIEEPAGQDGFLNILEITAAYKEDGTELVLNNSSAVPSIRQLAIDTVKISGLTEPTVISFVYQASPAKIVIDESFDLDEVSLDIPETIIEALLYYVASRVYKPSGANNSTANADKSIAYQQQYELACQKIDMYGLGIQDCDRDDTFTERGWV